MVLRGDPKNLISGGISVTMGVFIALYAYSNYDLGAVNDMGPGMVPMMLGFILTGLGTAIFVHALFASGTIGRPDWRPAAAILGALALFGLMIDHFGIVPSVIAPTVLASFADGKLAPQKAALLGLLLAAFTVVLLIYVVGLPLRAFDWKF